MEETLPTAKTTPEEEQPQQPSSNSKAQPPPGNNTRGKNNRKKLPPPLKPTPKIVESEPAGAKTNEKVEISKPAIPSPDDMD